MLCTIFVSLNRKIQMEVSYVLILLKPVSTDSNVINLVLLMY